MLEYTSLKIGRWQVCTKNQVGDGILILVYGNINQIHILAQIFEQLDLK